MNVKHITLTEQEFADIKEAIEVKLAVLIPRPLCEEDHIEIRRFQNLLERLK